MKSPVPLHPPLVALYPAVSVYAANAWIMSLDEVWRPALVVLGACLAAWAALWIISRDVARAAAGVSVATFLFFAYGPLRQVFNPSGSATGNDRLYWAWIAAATLLTALTLWKSGRKRPMVTRAMNAIAALMLLFATLSAGYQVWRLRVLAVAKSRQAGPFNQVRPETRPSDVYYIVLDGYGRADALQRVFGFSNAEFLGELERRGFTVSQGSRSNYVQTQLSLASSLNMDFVSNLVEPTNSGDWDRVHLSQLIDDNRVMREFRNRGYKTIGVTTGFPGVTFQHADHVFPYVSGVSLFLSALLARTPIPEAEPEITGQFDRRRRTLRGAFELLGRLAPSTAAPRLFLVHVVAPHPPFVFGPNGERVRYKGPYGFFDGSHYYAVGGSREGYRTGYIDQLRYLNRLTVDAIDAILKRNDTDPVIVLQGDHGSKLGLEQESLQGTDVAEAFSILMAVRAPQEVRSEFRGTVTPVNCFRILLSKMFGANLPALRNASFYSEWSHPLRLTEVTALLDEAARRARPATGATAPPAD